MRWLNWRLSFVLELKKNSVNRGSKSAYAWALGLATLVLLPGLLLGVAIATTEHHLSWSRMHHPMIGHPGLFIFLAVLILLSGLYVWRLGYGIAWVIRSNRNTIARVRPRMAPFPCDEIPLKLLPRNVSVKVGMWNSPDAFTYGIIHPTIVISESLRTLLDGPGLEAILAHEVHHARSHDYALQQVFLTIQKAFPFLPIESLYRVYLVAREIQADRFAIAWQETKDPLLQAMVTTVHALSNESRPRFSEGPAWNSVWEARINALIDGDSVSLFPETYPLVSAAAMPFATSAVLAATSWSLFCH